MMLPHVFYDGTCGLCHFMVRFILKRMKKTPFLFSPLGGLSFQSFLQEQKISSLPNSIIVFVPQENKIYSQAEAIIFILNTLGTIWRLLGFFLNLLPHKYLNIGYTALAKIRNKIFKQPQDVCPFIPKEFKKFFRN